MNAEQTRLEAQRKGVENWRLWGPYLSERAWGTVREDYSAHGDAWNYFPHDQARSRTYRWGEDGLGGICDEQQRLCLALALWNGKDSILKERAFGLSESEGNHGEDVKEYYFYLDATPSHSFLKYLYKYPQTEYPYEWLVAENQRRSRLEPSFSLLDTKIFAENRYWDVEVIYAKENPQRLIARITATNRGPEEASLHLLPTLWFRNTWAWAHTRGQASLKPRIKAAQPQGAAWAVIAEHPALGVYHLYGQEPAETLFTENETNQEQLFGVPNPSPYVKDAFHRRVIHGEMDAVNPNYAGTKFSAWSIVKCGPGESANLTLVLSAEPLQDPFGESPAVLSSRQHEADLFYQEILPGASEEDARIFRQAAAGMIWCKQFYYFNVSRWLKGDLITPPPKRLSGRDHTWRQLEAADVISMPDAWEYPYFASWDLAFHSIIFSLVDVDFAKDQLELLLNDRYLHPDGQIPAYEYSFSNVNPPVHATAVLEVFRRERKQRGQGDHAFLRRVFNKLIMNFCWWVNRQDSDGQNVFEGGSMGMDNIFVVDRTQSLPSGYSLKEADATGWMAMFSLNMTAIAIELAQEEPEYEYMAIQFYKQFIAIAHAIGGHTSANLPLWNDQAGTFESQLVLPDGSHRHLDIFSYVELIPLFASEVQKPALLDKVPHFKATLQQHKGGVVDENIVSADPVTTNEDGQQLLSLADQGQLRRILSRVLDENQFLSQHGIRSLSRIHAHRHDLGTIPGLGTALIDYEPGEATTAMFGGNSNWRGPVWLPINYLLMRTLSRFHRYYGPDFRISLPQENREANLAEIVDMLCERLINIFRRNDEGIVPAFPPGSPFQHDPHWRNLCLFFEYYHGETGQGLGAMHQTGWSGLIANLIKKNHP